MIRHQHGGKLFLLTKDGKTTFAKVIYDRWLCTGCKGITLVPEFRGLLNPEDGPILSVVAEGIFALIASDNTTIDMTTEQAANLGLLTKVS